MSALVVNGRGGVTAPLLPSANRAGCRSRADSTRAQIAPNVGRRRLAAALVVDALDESFWNGTRGTSTGMSMRSSSGPESRFWQRL